MKTITIEVSELQEAALNSRASGEDQSDGIAWFTNRCVGSLTEIEKTFKRDAVSTKVEALLAITDDAKRQAILDGIEASIALAQDVKVESLK